MVGRDGSPIRARDVSPRRYTKKMVVAEQMVEPQYAVSSQRYDLVIPEKTVQKIMGPDPIPTIDIEFDEIQNEL